MHFNDCIEELIKDGEITVEQVETVIQNLENFWWKKEQPHYEQWQKGYIACLHDIRRKLQT